MHDPLDIPLKESSLDSVATSTILELRRIITNMGVESAHDILDELETLIHQNSKLKA